MTAAQIIFIQGTTLTLDFISGLSLEGNFHIKILTEYTSEFKEFRYWLENSDEKLCRRYDFPSDTPLCLNN
ncbi:hypothetical protein U0X36_05275 [Bacillus thuringiensis]|uniref:hypothetical protein n=1 Tax=Bacillus thuringiensis TaxID=1428 RepID=UPI000E522A80|nr:hypothetical protein [Bacillus thuringiensis]MDZ3952359.1 hypothetical protein [Bacillus thuringiensis]RGP45193.1 hypothetical protein BTW32_25790 [Bacillus thuringiensis]